MKRTFFIIAASAAFVSCMQKELMEEASVPTGPTVSLTINVDYPAADGTKVTLEDGQQLAWKGDETMTLIFGKYTSDGSDNKLNPTLKMTSPGVFSGTVTLPSEDYTMDDLQGFVVPSEVGAFYDWRSYDSESGAVTAWISMPVAAEQTQAKAGVPNMDYAPFFYDLSGVTKTADAGGGYTFSGLQLNCASQMLRFNVYGSKEEDEILKSVSLSTSSDCHVGTANWPLGRKSGEKIENNGARYSVVNLEEEVKVPSATSGNTDGVVVFMTYMCKNNRTITEVEVTTDKAFYQKTYPTSGDGKMTLYRTYSDSYNVHLANLNLSGFIRYTENSVEYSADGGEWTSECPANCSKLAVRTLEGCGMSKEVLSDIAAAIADYDNPVELDLSGTDLP